jgi:hypothetical protein
MDSDFMVAIRYIFVLSFILIIVAYWGGSTHVLSTGGTVLTNLINTSTGRTSGGSFAGYPGGGPTN